MKETIAYVYKWTHLPTMKWYIGSRTAEGCCPEDGYICSSALVNPLIESAATDWKREVVATGTPLEMYELETDILQLVDARKDPMSFNGHNNDGNYFSPIPWNKGLTTQTAESNKRRSMTQSGKLRPLEVIAKIKATKAATKLQKQNLLGTVIEQADILHLLKNNGLAVVQPIKELKI